MRTLDEVIEGIEACRDSYVAGKIIKDDALHYLKEYQKKQKTLEIRAAEYKRGFEQLGMEWSRIKDNPPLTMEYFSKQIDTEPIWCEKLGEWYLFLAYDDGENEIQLMSDKGDIETFDEEDLEKYPLYRKERG